MKNIQLAICISVLGICLLPVLAHATNPAARPDTGIRAQTAPAGDRLAKLKINKWCCHFTDILGHHKNVTISSGVAAVTACWGVAASIVPAVKNLHITKGAC